VEKNYFKKKELFSAVKHEIKNSLNPVINLSSVLLRNTSERLTADENSYLEAIERNGKMVLNLVDEFSFVSKLSDLLLHPAKEKKYVNTLVNVREMIDNAFISMMALSNCSDCRLICDVDEESSAFITDKKVFCSILANVCLFFISQNCNNPSVFFKTAVSNSKFSLIVSRKKTDFIISDNTVFDKDKIIESGYSAGSIMRLSFVSLYVNYLKGDVHFSHDSEGDVVFYFSIPVGMTDSGILDVETDVKEESRNKTCREFVMLVIDDDIDNIIPVNAIIAQEFYGKGKVYHAESGGKGLDMLGEIKPDIILLDLTLPDISGLSLVKNIKNLFVGKNIPVIAFTGMDIGDKEKIKRAGFDDVIKKPFNIDHFIQKIRKWIY